MKAEVYQRLKALRDQFGPKECGKICQKLLAISLGMGGCTDIVERGVQGVDVDARHANGEKYTIEVKTTEGLSVPFGRKDVDALQKRSQQDGYLPVLGVLRICPMYEWFFVNASEMRPGNLLIDRLRPYRLKDLEACVEPLFDRAVCDHFEATVQRGQVYLDEVLRGPAANVAAEQRSAAPTTPHGPRRKRVTGSQASSG